MQSVWLPPSSIELLRPAPPTRVIRELGLMWTFRRYLLGISAMSFGFDGSKVTLTLQSPLLVHFFLSLRLPLLLGHAGGTCGSTHGGRV
jgi:hypothetical protein